MDARWVDAEQLVQDGPAAHLRGVDGILIPGGFGDRGIPGKVEATQYAREHGVPFLGICLGLQCAVIEFARNVCGLEGANSSEFDPATPFPERPRLLEKLDEIWAAREFPDFGVYLWKR